MFYDFRFCIDCRNKVFHAYNILVGEIDPPYEKGYLPGLYSEIRTCPPENHIHITGSTDYIRSLIRRAEPEMGKGYANM